jgi:hypothetical protein
MTSFTFTNGYLILVEGNNKQKTEWFKAKSWQETEFLKVMRLGTMKSMGMPNPIEYTKEFSRNGYKYRFIIENDWGPVHIENITTGKKREVKYFEIGEAINYNSVEDEHPPAKITTISKSC